MEMKTLLLAGVLLSVVYSPVLPVTTSYNLTSLKARATVCSVYTNYRDRVRESVQHVNRECEFVVSANEDITHVIRVFLVD